MTKLLDVSEEEFEDEVLESDLPVLVDFWAPWCGPCKMLTPVIEELSESYDGKLKVVKVNTEDEPDIAAKYGIRSIPAILLFVDGEEVDQVIGFRPKGDFEKMIDPHLS